MPLPEPERKAEEEALWAPLFARAYRRVLKGTRRPSLPVLGSGPYCWCGGDYRHDWPGKAEGAPHPR